MVRTVGERTEPSDLLRPGTATSIGSLPHTDPDEAARFVLEHHPELPAAPSLPNRSPAEGMLAQAVWGVGGLAVDDDGAVVLTGRPAEVARTRDPLDLGADAWRSLDVFLDHVRGRTAPVKVQSTGAVTLGRALLAAGMPVERAFAVAGAVVRARVAELVAVVRERLPQTPLLVMLDEPGLVGSSHPRFPISTGETLDLLTGCVAAIEQDAGPVLTGIHCCGAADWTTVLEAGPDVLAAPADAGLGFVPGAIEAFLDRGGRIAWGAIPTDEPIGTSAEHPWRKLTETWCVLVRGGLDPVRLRRRALVTPACGLAGHGTSQAGRALRLAADVGERIHEQTTIARLTVGA
ncbi:MAG: hypothetical protein AAGK32_01250 [Actinomycetota bacterium]